MNTAFYCFMKLLPKCTVSRLFGEFTRLKIPVLSNVLKNLFAKHYKINMYEAEFGIAHYKNIEELFTRKLMSNARPIDDSEIVSPVDGLLSGAGLNSQMIQAKGKTYSLESLLRNEYLARQFEGGAWCTIYLSPHDYHRIHAPINGTVKAAYYCPGNLWPVNASSVNRVEGLFCINERLITHLQCSDGAEILVVKVGATNVGRIAVNYTDELLTNSKKMPKDLPRLDWTPKKEISLKKGEELGRFEMGSTVILVLNKTLAARNASVFKSKIGHAVKMGESL